MVDVKNIFCATTCPACLDATREPTSDEDAAWAASYSHCEFCGDHRLPWYTGIGGKVRVPTAWLPDMKSVERLFRRQRRG